MQADNLQYFIYIYISGTEIYAGNMPHVYMQPWNRIYKVIHEFPSSNVFDISTNYLIIHSSITMYVTPTHC